MITDFFPKCAYDLLSCQQISAEMLSGNIIYYDIFHSIAITVHN